MLGDSEFVNETLMLDADHFISTEESFRVKHITADLAISV